MSSHIASRDELFDALQSQRMNPSTYWYHFPYDLVEYYLIKRYLFTYTPMEPGKLNFASGIRHHVTINLEGSRRPLSPQIPRGLYLLPNGKEQLIHTYDKKLIVSWFDENGTHKQQSFVKDGTMVTNWESVGVFTAFIVAISAGFEHYTLGFDGTILQKTRACYPNRIRSYFRYSLKRQAWKQYLIPYNGCNRSLIYKSTTGNYNIDYRQDNFIVIISKIIPNEGSISVFYITHQDLIKCLRMAAIPIAIGTRLLNICISSDEIIYFAITRDDGVIHILEINFIRRIIRQPIIYESTRNISMCLDCEDRLNVVTEDRNGFRQLQIFNRDLQPIFSLDLEKRYDTPPHDAFPFMVVRCDGHLYLATPGGYEIYGS